MQIPLLTAMEEIADSSRRRILTELLPGERTVTDLVQSTSLKQPNVSNHLARMRSKGIIVARKVGRQVHYSIADAQIEAGIRNVLQANMEIDALPDYSELSRQFSRAAVQGDETSCNKVMERLLRARAPILDIYEEVLAHSMHIVGTWYKVGAINEGQEHFASEITSRAMAQAAGIAGQAKPNGLTALIGNGEGNFHVIAIRMIADLMRVRGWNVLYLGGNTPEKSFIDIVRVNRPHLVLVSCSADESYMVTESLIHALHELRKTENNFQLGIGGSYFARHPERATKLPAEFIARSIREFATLHLPEAEQIARSFTDRRFA